MREANGLAMVEIAEGREVKFRRCLVGKHQPLGAWYSASWKTRFVEGLGGSRVMPAAEAVSCLVVLSSADFAVSPTDEPVLSSGWKAMSSYHILTAVSRRFWHWHWFWL
jgi:hypothetical protein